MNKATAIALLGGSVSSAAEQVGVSPSAVSQWPDELPERISDRVLAAMARKHLPPELIGLPPAASANAAAAALEAGHAG